jgi:hypothetical protein
LSVKFKQRRNTVKRKFSLGVSVQARDLTNLRVVLDTQHEHGQRPGAEHLLLLYCSGKGNDKHTRTIV